MTFSGRWGYSPENVRTKSESCFNIALISLIAPRNAYKEENTVIQADFTVFSGVYENGSTKLSHLLSHLSSNYRTFLGVFQRFLKNPKIPVSFSGKHFIALYRTPSHFTTYYRTEWGTEVSVPHTTT